MVLLRGAIKVVNRLHSTVCPRSVAWQSNSRPGVLFASIRNTLDLGVTPLGALEFYLDWT